MLMVQIAISEPYRTDIYIDHTATNGCKAHLVTTDFSEVQGYDKLFKIHT